eukprot:403372331
MEARKRAGETIICAIDIRGINKNCMIFQKILNKKMAQLRTTYDQDLLDCVEIIGNFSKQTWQNPLSLKYSDMLDCFYIDLLIPRHSQFKFIVDGKYDLSEYYPVIKDGHNLNNTFFEVPFPQSAFKLTSKAAQKTPQNLKYISLDIIEKMSEVKISNGQSPSKILFQNYTTSAIKMDIKIKSESIIEVKKPIQKQSQQEVIKSPRKKFSEHYRNQKTQKPNIYSVYDCRGHLMSIYETHQQLEEVRSKDEITSSSQPSFQRYDSSTLRAEDEKFIFIGDGYQISKNPRGPSEDAFFITEIGAGVSDGVGSWSNYGIDSSLFSNTLMRECQKFIQRVVFRQQQSIIDSRITQQELECHRQALESFRRTHFPGSATATICVLNNRDLSALNLGDSGFILIRFDMLENDPYILLKSKEQQHSFNTPFQLTRLPQPREVESLKAQNRQKELENLKKAMKEKKFCEDSPEDSDNYHLRVREGDLLILGTDGVFDNLFEDEILQIVKTYTRQNQAKTKVTASILAKQISEASYAKSQLRNIKTPFNVRKAQAIFDYITKQKQNLQEKAPQVQLSPSSMNSSETQYSQSQQSLINLGYQSSTSQLEDAELAEIQNQIKQERDFESMCYGKGKTDDITVVAMWISHKYNHASQVE